MLDMYVPHPSTAPQTLKACRENTENKDVIAWWIRDQTVYRRGPTVCRT